MLNLFASILSHPSLESNHKPKAELQLLRALFVFFKSQIVPIFTLREHSLAPVTLHNLEP